MTQLTQHFSLDELTITQQRGLDNTPPAEVTANLMRLAAGLEKVREYLGAPIIISSGYRSPEVNAAVGGQKNSQHLTGNAADFIAPKFGTPAMIVTALTQSRIEYDQLILEFNRWVHISFADKPRKMALVIDRAGTRAFA